MSEKQDYELLTLSQHPNNRLVPIEINEGRITAKTVSLCNGAVRYKKAQMFHAELTVENQEKARAYNEKLNEFLAYQDKAMGEIFGENQVQTWEDPDHLSHFRTLP